MQRQLLYKYIIGCIPVKTCFTCIHDQLDTKQHWSNHWCKFGARLSVCSTNRRLEQSSGNKFEKSPWPHINMHISLLYSIYKTAGEKHLNDDLLLAILKYTTKELTVHNKCSTGMSRLHHTICIHTIPSFVDRRKVISYSKSTCLKIMQF